MSPTRQALAVAVGAVAALGAMTAPAVASAAGHSPRHPAPVRPALPPGERYVCPAVPIGQMTCMAIIKMTAASGFAALAGGPHVAFAPVTPNDLRKAYKLTKISPNGGKGRLVAIVDAFNNPHLAADLKVYRAHFHLPPCTTSNGCLRILNQKGKNGPLPPTNRRWGVEESLDLDMVSAICPRCHITLIEATNSGDANLAKAEDTAVARGARYVSNSWGSREFARENAFTRYFNHPGDVIDFASGDLGYGPTFPAAFQYVTSIGGTTLKHASNGRGWTETVWGSVSDANGGTASGCSKFLAKPSWQLVDVGFTGACTKRTQNDVAADANPATGAIIYDTFPPFGVRPGAFVVGGTSEATPIITAIYALAGTPVRNTYPAQYMYLHQTHLFDVSSGANGMCPGRKYLCHGLPGYDGPTGLGTPNGTTAFKIGAGTHVTLVDPGTRRGTTSGAVAIKIIGLDSRKGGSLTYSMSGAPTGLHIARIPKSTDGLISGTPTQIGTFNVTVTARDGSATGTTHFQIIVS